MKKMIFLMLTLLIWSAASMNAQVNIGSVDSPKDGAILDLSQGSQKLGLILPNVKLENVSDWQLDAGNGSDVAGTVVFNTNADLKDALGTNTLGQGIFVWNGNGWLSAKGGTGEVLAKDFTLTSGGSDVIDGSTVSLWTGGTQSFAVEASSFVPTSAEVAKGVKWVISPASFAAIQAGSTNTACVVEGLTEGTATLTVTSLDNNVTKTVTVNVQSVAVSGFDLDKDVLNLEAGGATGTVTASSFTFSDGQSHPAPAVSWVTNGDVKGSLENKQDDTYTVTPGNQAASWTVVASAGSITKPAFTVNVTCPTATATLTSAAGTDAQSVFKETAITNITYDLTNVVASGAAVTGLPDGLTAVQNGNTLTISGTVSASAGVQAYNYTVKLKNVCGTETDGATGSINVNPSSAAKDYNISPTTDNGAGTDGSMAKGWGSAANDAGSGNYWTSYPATGATPSSGTNLMVSNKVYSNANEVSSPNASANKQNAAQSLSALSDGITWADAVKKCVNLTEGGFDDWYLPNNMELDVLYNNAYLGYSAIGSRTIVFYWSSTERSATIAWGRSFFSSGTLTDNLFKANASSTSWTWVARCVRRTN